VASENLIYSVPGVTCEHCRLAIAREVEPVPGVESVRVDLDRKIVAVRGEGISAAAVRAAIAGAGYDVEAAPEVTT
jgi:copper chaperone